MSDQLKMVPVSLLKKCRVLAAMQNEQPTRHLIDLDEILNAPVPPAGDVEVLGYKFNFAGWVGTEGPQGWRLEFDTEKPAQFLFDDGRVKDYVELVDRAHVTRLTAELKIANDRLRIEVDTSNKLGAERDDWKARCARRVEDIQLQAQRHEQTKSELTKARELNESNLQLLRLLEHAGLGDNWKARVSRAISDATPIAHNVDESCGQDAEAAKGGA